MVQLETIDLSGERNMAVSDKRSPLFSTTFHRSSIGPVLSRVLACRSWACATASASYGLHRRRTSASDSGLSGGGGAPGLPGPVSAVPPGLAAVRLGWPPGVAAGASP